jgi:hypothetical protein
VRRISREKRLLITDAVHGVLFLEIHLTAYLTIDGLSELDADALLEVVQIPIIVNDAIDQPLIERLLRCMCIAFILRGTDDLPDMTAKLVDALCLVGKANISYHDYLSGVDKALR